MKRKVTEILFITIVFEKCFENVMFSLFLEEMKREILYN